MNTETLKKANELSKLISDHESALSCFEWDANYYENINRPENKQLPPKIFSTNPRLIIEYDGDGREQQLIPMGLSDFLINIIKDQIKENLNKIRKEFEEL